MNNTLPITQKTFQLLKELDNRTQKLEILFPEKIQLKDTFLIQELIEKANSPEKRQLYSLIREESNLSIGTLITQCGYQMGIIWQLLEMGCIEIEENPNENS